MKEWIFFTVLALACCSCGYESRRQQLDEREKKLNEREQVIMLKEKELKLLEDSLNNLISKDSTALANAITGVPLPDSLAGAWDVNMVCTKTNCQGFAVGDTRKETWVLTDRNATVSVKAMQGDKIIRLYTGTFDGENFNLSTPKTGIDSLSASMTVELKIESAGKISGQRSITQSDNCNTIFRIDMNRSNKSLSGI